MSIEETAWRTRIRPDVLLALEDEDFTTIGHQAFVRSHLASYARFLGLDPAEVVRQFVSGHEEPEPSSLELLHTQNREARKPPRAKWVIAAAISTGVLIVAAAVGVLGGQAEPTPAGFPQVPAPSQRLTDRASRTDADGRTGTVPAAEARVRLTVTALEDTDVSITIDGSEVFEDPLREGASRTFYARDSVEILAADGGAVRLSLNGRVLGLAGEPGTVFRGRYGPSGRLAD